MVYQQISGQTAPVPWGAFKEQIPSVDTGKATSAKELINIQGVDGIGFAASKANSLFKGSTFQVSGLRLLAIIKA